MHNIDVLVYPVSIGITASPDRNRRRLLFFHWPFPSTRKKKKKKDRSSSKDTRFKVSFLFVYQRKFEVETRVLGAVEMLERNFASRE